MPDISLALNCDCQSIATATAILVDDAFDMCFVIRNCTAFKLQGSTDAGSTYNDIAGTSTLLGSTGTLTAGTAYMLSLTRCRFDHVKPVYSGTNPVVVYIRRYTRQQPKVGLDKTIQRTIVDPQLGTA